MENLEKTQELNTLLEDLIKRIILTKLAIIFYRSLPKKIPKKNREQFTRIFIKIMALKVGVKNLEL